MPTVCVDFDGVIHAYSKGWQDGSIYDGPVDGALEALATLQEHYAVVVHTTREPAPVAEWLSERGVHACSMSPGAEHPEFWNTRDIVLVTQRKLPAVAYIDDRAVRFVSWPQTLAFMEGLKTSHV